MYILYDMNYEVIYLTLVSIYNRKTQQKCGYIESHEL